MKKIIITVLVLALCLALMAGCGKKEEEAPAPIGMVNPVTSYADAQGQVDALGFGLEAPEGASDIAYQSINSMAETIFTLDGVKYSYRAEASNKTEAYDISGLFYEMESSEASVQGRDATVMTCSEAGSVMWLDIVTGVNYNLSAVSAVDADALVELANAIYVPLQGEAG